VDHKLNPNKQADSVEDLRKKLCDRVIGQDDAANKVADCFTKVLAGIYNRERPILNVLFLGPTGVGKTETVKVLTEHVFGERSMFTRINCQELSQEHNISRLLGSPPGYVGHDIDPMLSQGNVDQHYDEALRNGTGIFGDKDHQIIKNLGEGKLSIICFDEIEKAHPKIWNSLLGLTDDGHVTLACNDTVDFTKSIIIMTSNVGSKKIGKTLESNGLGFDLGNSKESRIEDVVLESVKDVFPHEFINRFDDIICFNPLSKSNIKQILHVILQDVYYRLLNIRLPILLDYSDNFIDFMVDKGYSPEFGARPMKKAVDRYLVTPLSRLITSDQIPKTAHIIVDASKTEVEFYLKEDNNKDLVIPPSLKESAK
jgi:ATP-dependent Clp protease ATP-binding subunit ClpA